MTVRIVLADDQDLLREGFAMILGAQPDLEVVGQAADGGEALAVVAATRPDVVLMDVRMPVMDGIEATRRMAASGSPAKVIILTTFDLDEYAFEGVRAGASGFLLKSARPDELIAGIRAVAEGDAVLAPATTRRLLDAYAGGLRSPDQTFQDQTFRDQAPPDPSPPAGAPSHAVGRGDTDLEALTLREREVFAGMAAGRNNSEIAASLYLSVSTVKTHVARILDKLDLRDRIQAVIFAYECGLAGPTGRPGGEDPGHPLPG